MADMWMPGAVRDSQPGGVTLNKNLPPRATWHITWDKVTDGAQPPMANVSGYLKRAGYCPHLMWNPFTGEIIQYYPANVGGRALNAWNEDGAVNIQIEVYFSPGVNHAGRAYQDVAQTPAKGWANILTWLDTLGIPRAWPMGAPKWQGNPRDVDVWNSKPGHYGHCNVPDNTHTDPGPMPSLGITSGQAGTITPIEEDTLSDTQVERIINEVNAAAEAKHRVTREAIVAERITIVKEVRANVAVATSTLAGEVAGFREVVNQLSAGTGATIDLAAVEAAAKRGAEAALAEGVVKVDVTVAGGDQ